MTSLHHAAARLPRLPERADVPEAELADYDHMVVRIKRGFGPTKEIVDGVEYGVPHFSALAASPSVAAAISQVGRAVTARQDLPGSFTAADHELIDLVLGFDSGYWVFLAGHTPGAISAGVRIAAIRAIRDGHEELLTADERQQVEFIRAVRDGTMTDEIWIAMRDRIGTERGVVDHLLQICLLLLHHHFTRAVGVPECTPEFYEQMLTEYEDGTREMPISHAERQRRMLLSEL